MGLYTHGIPQNINPAGGNERLQGVCGSAKAPRIAVFR